MSLSPCEPGLRPKYSRRPSAEIHGSRSVPLLDSAVSSCPADTTGLPSSQCRRQSVAVPPASLPEPSEPPPGMSGTPLPSCVPPSIAAAALNPQPPRTTLRTRVGRTRHDTTQLARDFTCRFRWVRSLSQRSLHHYTPGCDRVQQIGR